MLTLSVLEPPFATCDHRNPATRWHLGLHTNVGALDSGLGRPEAQSDVLIPSPTTLSDTLALAALSFGVEEDVRLLLESAFALDCKFGRHDRGDRYLVEKEG